MNRDKKSNDQICQMFYEISIATDLEKKLIYFIEFFLFRITLYSHRAPSMPSAFPGKSILLITCTTIVLCAF